MKHSIKTAVWIRVLVIFLAVLISGGVTVSGLRSITKYNHSSKQATELLSLALNAEKAHLSWVESLSSAIGFDTEFTGSTDYTSCVLGTWLYNTDPESLPEQLVSLIGEIEPVHKTIHESATEVLELKNSSGEARAKEAYLNTTKAGVTELVAMLDQVVTGSQELVAQNEKNLDAAIRFTIIVSGITMVLILCVAYLLVRFIVRRVINPIQQITVSGQQFAHGNLHLQVDIDRDDEIGLLAQSLKDSCSTLSLYVKDISDKLEQLAHGNLAIDNDLTYIGDFTRIQSSLELIVRQLNTTMSQISQTATQVSHGSDQIAASAQTLAQGATEQAQEIDQLLRAVHEVSEQIAQNAQDAAFTNDTVLEVGQQIELCNQQMHEMASAMQEISHSSQQIGNIIKTIDDIAFQTNILALNAAVEAARAGAAGKGFAVVADEVRNLASKSAEAAQSTTALIDQSLQAVKAGASLMDETQKSLDLVVEGAKTVTEKVKNISNSSAEQSETVSNITAGISQISQVVQTNSATSEESAAASEELSGQAQTLNQLVGQFRIREELYSLS